MPEIYWEYTIAPRARDGVHGGHQGDRRGRRSHRIGVDPQDVAQLVTDAYCEQLYLHGMFHADPHPGNLFVQRGADGNPVLVMLDFGLCRKYDDKFRIAYARMVNAMLRADLPEMIEAYKALGIKVKNPNDPTRLHRAGPVVHGDGEARHRLRRRRPRRRKPTSGWRRSIRANPIVDIPREMLLIMRVVGLLSGLGKHLDSRVNVVNTLLPYTQAALDGARAEQALSGLALNV